MRLRQCACSPSLVPQARLRAARDVVALLSQRAAAAAGSKGKGKAAAAPLAKDEAQRLFDALRGKLQQAEEAECAVCLEAASAETIRILRACRHAFCRPCLAGVVAAERGGSRCPLCRAPFAEEARMHRRTLSRMRCHLWGKLPRSSVSRLAGPLLPAGVACALCRRHCARSGRSAQSVFCRETGDQISSVAR